ncbi:MAG: hypothetical protein WC749_02275 [Dehalococcoidia bacterium]
MIKRDELIFNEVAAARFVTSEQIHRLILPHTKGPQKTNQRLRELQKAKLIKKRRLGDTGLYVYYSGKWSEKWWHWVTLNQVRVELVRQAKGWQKVAVFSREYVFGDLRTDALVAVDNAVIKKRTVFFVEVDNGTNPFVDKYMIMLNKTELSLDPPWWAIERFPRVLVITNRAEKARAIVEGSPVEYRIATLDEVREDVYKCLR